MFHRTIKPPKSESFFLFGARGTGKSTWVRQVYPQAHYIDLLSEEAELRYSRNADLLESDLAALRNPKLPVVIDEIQKAPRLLDIVHRLIEKTGRQFILTGSSARKLKRNAANLLAGRAFVRHLHPLTCLEQGERFNLEENLRFGSLPKRLSLGAEDAVSYLKAYAQVYLKEEILLEQLVRNGQGFRDFLLLAALENGNSLNFSKIARDLGVDTKTVQTFFQIMEDTLVGFFLPAFHRSLRKSQKKQPKFYLFDLGVKRAMEGTLGSELVPQTSAYGRAFEHLVILECFRLNDYSGADFRLSHFQTAQGAEIDLLLTRGQETIAVEIKSAKTLDRVEVNKLSRMTQELGFSRSYYLSQDSVPSDIDGVLCRPWRAGLKEIFGLG